MVINLGLAKAGAWGGVRAEIEAVRAAAPHPAVLKVIIESGLLTDDEIVAACHAAVAAGADFVKTSTGFHATAGGATVEAVRLMRATVGPDLGVKASGGIRSAEKALAMIEAGANRIGTSSTAAILADLPSRTSRGPSACAVGLLARDRRSGETHPRQMPRFAHRPAPRAAPGGRRPAA